MSVFFIPAGRTGGSGGLNHNHNLTITNSIFSRLFETNGSTIKNCNIIIRQISTLVAVITAYLRIIL
jgi:hypothetical protein